MLSLVQPVTAFIGHHPEWAAAILGVATFLESLVVVGALVPATAFMLVAGGLIARGLLDAPSVILCCTTGAVLGDTLSFLIGRRLGPGAWRLPVLARHRRLLARARLFFARYGATSIGIGRFLGPMRAVVPLVAGMLRMRKRRFYVATSISAVIWVCAMLAPGYLATLGWAELGLMNHRGEFKVALVAAAALALAAFVGWRLMSRAAHMRAIGGAAVSRPSEAHDLG